MVVDAHPGIAITLARAISQAGAKVTSFPLQTCHILVRHE
jgi:hypothetical protein